VWRPRQTTPQRRTLRATEAHARARRRGAPLLSFLTRGSVTFFAWGVGVRVSDGVCVGGAKATRRKGRSGEVRDRWSGRGGMWDSRAMDAWVARRNSDGAGGPDRIRCRKQFLLESTKVLLAEQKKGRVRASSFLKEKGRYYMI